MKKLYIVVSLIVSENQYQQEQAAAAKEAAQRLGAEIEVIYGGNDVAELRKKSKVPVFAVTVDHHEVGRIQGRQLGALLPDGGLVLCILGPTSNPAFKMRLEGLESTKPANVQMRTLPGKLTEQSGYEAVVNWLSLST